MVDRPTPSQGTAPLLLLLMVDRPTPSQGTAPLLPVSTELLHRHSHPLGHRPTHHKDLHDERRHTQVDQEPLLVGRL